MKHRNKILAVVALTATMLATCVAALHLRIAEAADAERTFAVEAEAVSDSILETMRVYAQVLKAGAGLFIASKEVTRDEWSDFVARLELEEQYPGIQGLGYAKRLNESDIASHVARQRELGRPEYAYHPESDRPTKTAITFLEPEDWRNKRALGYDMYSEPARREAMTRARDDGEVRLSSRVTLVQETDTDVQPGLLMYMPLYHKGSPTQTVDERRKNLTGYVYAVFRMHDLVGKITGRYAPSTLQNTEFNIFDGLEIRANAMLFSEVDRASSKKKSGRHSEARKLIHFDHINVAGKDWTLQFRSKQPAETLIDRSRSTIFFTLGALISFLIFGIVVYVTRSQEKAEQISKQLANEIEEKNKAQKQISIVNREMAHRVKNTLAVVQGIMQKTMQTSPNFKTFGEGFEKRLQSLAKSYDIMVRANWSGVSFHDLIKTHLDFTGCVERINIHGPAVEIHPEAAQNIGLALHELATNSIKHGALSTEGGTIDISWKELPDDGMARLHWREQTTFDVRKPERSGFGTFVLERIVPASLGGNATLEFGKRTIDWRAEIPAKQFQIRPKHEGSTEAA